MCYVKPAKSENINISLCVKHRYDSVHARGTKPK